MSVHSHLQSSCGGLGYENREVHDQRHKDRVLQQMMSRQNPRKGEHNWAIRQEDPESTTKEETRSVVID